MNTRDSYMPYIALALFAGWMALEFWPRPKPASPSLSYPLDSSNATTNPPLLVDTSTTNAVQFEEVNDLPPENSLYIYHPSTNLAAVLFELRTNNVPVITILHSGEVLYDTNNVGEATRLFWQELSWYLKRQGGAP